MAYTYKYPRPAVTADCIVITKEAEPKVLLIEAFGRLQGKNGMSRYMENNDEEGWD